MKAPKRRASVFLNVLLNFPSWSRWTVVSLTAPSPIPILYDSSNNLHRCIEYHPETPERISVCVDALRKRASSSPGDAGYDLIDVAVTPPLKSSESADVAPSKSFFSPSELDHARRMLVRVHSEGYVAQIETKCRTSRQRRVEEGKSPLGFVGYVDGGDTYLTTESYDVFLRAAASWIRAVDHALGDDDDGPSATASGGGCGPLRSAVALTRPPGHHATKSLANGFCCFNFAAAAALHALESGRADKVSVLDWDVHYGQGVADILGGGGDDGEPRARYASIHQVPAFPYEGETRSISGRHRNVLTVPVAAGSTWEGGYRHIFETVALPFVCSREGYPTGSEKWIPDVVIVCAGYDALSADELASVDLDPRNYADMVQLLCERMVRESPDGDQVRGKVPGLVLGLEGGYQLQDSERGLSAAVLDTVNALARQ